MRYAGIINNDVVNGYDVCVSFWTQGCPHKCWHCHNPQTWSFDGGIELPSNINEIIDEAITKNGIERNFSILGGEPLCDENKSVVLDIVKHVRTNHPNIMIFLWTGYIIDDIISDPIVNETLSLVDVIIDSPYEDDKRDITLYLRGSTNQRVIQVDKDKSNTKEKSIIYG